MAAPSRRLTTLWFSDIAGFTRLSSNDEPLALLAMDAMRVAVKSSVAEHQGTVIKFLGDGALAEFPSTEGGVEAALELVARFTGATAAMPGGPFQLHIGIHVGDVTVAADGDIFGDGVNRAARLEHLGEAGQILVSEEVYRLVRKRPELKFTSLGEKTAKGLEEPFQVFLVEAQGPMVERLQLLEKASAAPPPAPAQVARRRRKNSRAIGTGIVAGVLAFVMLGIWTAASRPSDVVESPRGPVSSAPLVSIPIPAKLPLPARNAAYTLPAWPSRADGAAPTTFAGFASSGKRYLASLRTREAASVEVLPLLSAALAQAEKEKPTPAQEAAIRGLVLFAVQRDAFGAEKAFRAGIAADAKNALAHLGYARLLTAWGRYGEALFQIDEAKKGKGATNAQIDAARGGVLFREVKMDDARDALQRSLKSEDLLATRILLARALIALDKPKDALKVLEPAISSFEVVHWQAYARLRDAGSSSAAKTRALQVASNADAGYAGAIILNEMGQTTKAVQALGRLADQKDPDLIWLAVDPEWTSLRGNADLKRIAARALSR